MSLQILWRIHLETNNLHSHYRELFHKYGDSPEAVQYSSLESQERRFEILIQVGDLAGKKILDFGCGTGQFGSYLKKNGINFQYYGVDIVDEFLDLCKSKHPEGNFGFMNDFDNQEFDYIFVGGVFNNKITDNRSFYQQTIRNLFKKTKIALSFNMMSAYVDFQSPDLYYEYPEEVFSFLKKEVTPFVTIRNDYQVKYGIVPFDFTAYAYRNGR